MADDLGFNDLSYRGSNEIPTYNIDALAYSGINLNNYRTPPLCTPSRSALMTGKYPHHIGMQDFNIRPDEPFGLPLDEKIMPQYFKDAGYVTKMIGKWNLGFFQEAYMPHNRGYDSFFGYMGPLVDYWDYTMIMPDRNYSRGYDMRSNFDVARNLSRKYATEMFTEKAVHAIKTHDKTKPLFLIVNQLAVHGPLQAKEEDIEKFMYIADERRRIYAAMVHQLDKSVGEIVKALRDTNLLDDSIVIFYSDNGGPTNPNTASNYPLRGQKFNVFEGGIRTNAIIYDKSLPQSVLRNKMFYVADWLPTLKTLSGANFEISTKIDGMDQTRMLKRNLGLRNEFVLIDDVGGYSAYIYDNYKLVNGTLQNDNNIGWLGTNNNVNIVDEKTYFQNVAQSDAGKALKFDLTSSSIEKLRKSGMVKCKHDKVEDTCNILNGPCLFKIDSDPCEQQNLAGSRKLLMMIMQLKFKKSISRIVPALRKPSDPNCDPKYFNYTWSPWQ